ncbi:hypothetical protein DSM106972_078520 [Dulcicalothrix desertica PCC 7102]|uniref:N-acetyltransferase domain-containing protein n=1 Tax=Dulcicalothrix desertica PCC 7102 TaxID=232991 RepID=A0A433UZC2_9CYAN|nr:GNAT family N-acetyltransferase [Dulcicalothrix desertica]RUS99150.1 hypothetical protein DSM106972_078520 [Dulcicalothrix desertica PCC 7102]TWH61004.1 putative acetyltransferase [Dulcicalothrix desertica PCC 7102]
MLNSQNNSQNNHPLPPGYSIRLATDEDIRKLNNNINIPILIGTFLGCLVISIPIIQIVIQQSLQNWENMQRAILYETGTRRNTPTIEDLYQIIINLGIDKFFLGITTSLAIGRGIYLLLQSLFPQSKHKFQRWVAEYKGKIIGQAILERKRSYTLLIYICVNSSHWWQGIGSCLVWNSIKDAKKPLYLTCRPGLKPFYQRFGFVSVPNFEQPVEFRRYNLGCVMVLLNKAILPLERRQSQYPLPANHSITSFDNIWMRWQVYKQLWSSQVFKQWRFYILNFIAVIYIPLILILVAIWNILITWDISWLAGIISIIALLTPIFTIFIYWQEWRVEINNNTVAYAHLSCRLKYSILYCLYAENSPLLQQISQAFLERLSRRIQLPIYLVCSRQEAKLYTQLGFFPISQQLLPFELQIIRFQHYVALKYTAPINTQTEQ